MKTTEIIQDLDDLTIPKINKDVLNADFNKIIEEADDEMLDVNALQ